MTAVSSSSAVDQQHSSPSSARINGAAAFTNGNSSSSSNGSNSGSSSQQSDKRPLTSGDESDDDLPLTVRQQQQAKKPKLEVDTAPLGSFEAALQKKTVSPPKAKHPPPPPPKTVTVVKKEDSDSEDDMPLMLRKAKQSSSEKKKRKEESDDDEYCPVPKKKEKTEKLKKEVKKERKSVSFVEVKTEGKKKGGKKKVKEEEEEVWRWWEEEKHADGVKWKTLEHKGPVFAPPYDPLPHDIHFKYDGHTFKLQQDAEEVATFYARMADHEYTTKDAFNKNFFKDWRKVMTPAEREKITELNKCDFRAMTAHFQRLTEERKAMTKEEKLKLKEGKDEEQKIYGYAMIDGHKQKIGNFRIEPPGLFRGRGGHPKMGKLKRRVQPEDVIINCGKTAKIPTPPPGHKWKEVRHDNTVTWLCGWTENVLGQNKYIMLNPGSKIKGEKDFEKFETARKLKTRVDTIRQQYSIDFKSKEMKVRQRAVALYFIDKLALRAGNEKDADEAADTVGCCSLRCEHVKLFDKLNDKEYVVEFDFLGKDSIRYFNQVCVEKRVFKNVQLFKENKQPTDDLFDRLDTAVLNRHLSSIMPGLTAKVFRTYNASITLQQQLDKLTKASDSVHDKILAYNRANRQVAVLCNHQRAVPKTHEKSMENLTKKMKDKKAELKAAKDELDRCRGEAAKSKARKKVERTKEQLKRIKIQHVDKDENKQIALGTSKLNYLDPRISVAWCKKHHVPIEKIYNKTQREKFRWAIDMATEDFVF